MDIAQPTLWEELVQPRTLTALTNPELVILDPSQLKSAKPFAHRICNLKPSTNVWKLFALATGSRTTTTLSSVSMCSTTTQKTAFADCLPFKEHRTFKSARTILLTSAGHSLLNDTCRIQVKRTVLLILLTSLRSFRIVKPVLRSNI